MQPCIAAVLVLAPALAGPRARGVASRVRGAAVMATVEESPSTSSAKGEPVDLSSSAPRVENGPPYSPLKTARAFYSAWNHGDFDGAAMQLSESVYFRDINYPEPFVGRSATRAYLKECVENLIGWTFVIDDWAEDSARQRLGLSWHVNDVDGNALIIPTKGISFLKMTDDNSQIDECTDINESFLKVPLDVGTPVLALTARASQLGASLLEALSTIATQRAPDVAGKIEQEAEPVLTANEPPSAIATARAFYALWNAGDVDGAAALLSDDVAFLDPNFASPFRGRAAAAEYLRQCVSILNGWQFVIDDHAEDSVRQRLGLKWHVEDGSGRPLGMPTEGTSFLTLSADLTQIVEVADHMAPFSTPPPELQMPLVAGVSVALELRRQVLKQMGARA